ncbi:MAG: type II toxin-antitoxin system RelB/DinJ family antitoxin [Candidatus Falkowbacteria bacterium]
MKTVTINIKTDVATKKRAKKIAEELGLSLSAVINGCLRTLIKNRVVSFSADPEEKPNDYMVSALREARKGRGCSPVFDNADDTIAWLKDKKRKYVH